MDERYRIYLLATFALLLEACATEPSDSSAAYGNSNGLAAYYPFDGTTKDMIGGNDGVIRSQVRPTANASAYAFAGAGYIAIERLRFNRAASIRSMTACARFRTRVSGETAKSNGALLDFDGAEYFSLFIRGDTGTVGFSTRDRNKPHTLYGRRKVNDGRWHHVCVVYRKRAKIIYVDGEQDRQIGNVHSGALGSGITRYGFIGDGSKATVFDGERTRSYFTGTIDDVRFYRKALTADQISSLSCGPQKPTLPTRFGPTTQRCPAGATLVKPGQTIPSKHSAGTTFCFLSGVHRLSKAIPSKSRDVFVGQRGAILSGAIRLSEWSKTGSNVWTALLPMPIDPIVNHEHNQDSPVRSEDGNNKAQYVFINGRFLRWARNTRQLTRDKFTIDYAKNQVHIGRNPAGLTVELGVTPIAFEGSAHSVTIKNLTFEKFATPAGNAAVIHPGEGAYGWTIENSELRLNHGRGISAGGKHLPANRPGTTIRGNLIRDMGWIGIGRNNSRGLVVENEITRANTLGFPFGWSAGGIKTGKTSNSTWERNYIHDNRGYGIWFDVNPGKDGKNVVRNNIIVNNTRGGIHYEIGANALIEGNWIENNGHEETVTKSGRSAGILVVASRFVSVRNNVLRNNHNAISALSTNRGNIGGLIVEGNDITLGPGERVGLYGLSRRGVPTPIWDSNIYRILEASANHWSNGGSWANWTATHGFDTSPEAMVTPITCAR